MILIKVDLQIQVIISDMQDAMEEIQNLGSIDDTQKGRSTMCPLTMVTKVVTM